MMEKTAEWERVNPVLFKGMLGVEIRSDGRRRIKIGDGKNVWTALAPVGIEDVEGASEKINAAVRDEISGSEVMTDVIKRVKEEFSESDAVADIIKDKVFNSVEMADIINGVKEEILKAGAKDKIIEYHLLPYRPSPSWLAKNRLLPLEYQIIKIEHYQELCDIMWCGIELNDTADWWYKCNEDGARNVDGHYMRVMASQAMFFRGAGQNPIKNGANNTLYDGKAIGTFIGDASRNANGHIGALTFYGANEESRFIYVGNILENGRGYAGGLDGSIQNIFYDFSRVFPVANEFRSASISTLVCISY
jgi:hypothetical protein